MFCTHCGQKSLGTAQFCFACGQRLASLAETRTVTPPTLEPTVHAVQIDSPTPKRCPKCGLFSPSSADPCDCGFSFGTGEGGRQIEYAGFWIRFAASLLDGFVLLGISFVGAIVFGVAGI